MCAITASFKKDKLLELYKLNAYRGESSHSFATFDFDEEEGSTRLGILWQDYGPLNQEVFDATHEGETRLLLAHSQAPTTTSSNIHPAVYGSCMLWHNGIVKQKELDFEWDTVWILQQIIDNGWSGLSAVDGTFACIMYNGENLFVFRNEIAPLFIDDDLNISSTIFQGSRSLKPNIVYRMNLEQKKLEERAYFTTKENPYYMPENT